MNYKSGKIIFNEQTNIETHITTYETISYKDYKAHLCTIEKDIDSSSRIILAWRYVSPRSECLRGYFFEGPW